MMLQHALLSTLLLLSMVLLAVPITQAQEAPVPTQVLVRAVSQDAKVLHDGVGGARITIRDLETGQLLARGVQQGSSGDTEAIMRTPRARGAAVYDTPGTAGYLATLQLTQPTMVEIVAEGPLAYPQATQRSAATMLLVPGRDVLGEGVLLTIHGFIVDVLAPSAAATAEVTPGQALPVQATVTMSCGCPTSPGGLWDADAIEVVARLVRDGQVLREVPLRYAGTQSTYAGTVEVPADAAGALTLEVLAQQAATANFGLDRHPLSLQAGTQ